MKRSPFLSTRRDFFQRRRLKQPRKCYVYERERESQSQSQSQRERDAEKERKRKTATNKTQRQPKQIKRRYSEWNRLLHPMLHPILHPIYSFCWRNISLLLDDDMHRTSLIANNSRKPNRKQIKDHRIILMNWTWLNRFSFDGSHLLSLKKKQKKNWDAV